MKTQVNYVRWLLIVVLFLGINLTSYQKELNNAATDRSYTEFASPRGSAFLTSPKPGFLSFSAMGPHSDHPFEVTITGPSNFEVKYGMLWGVYSRDDVQVSQRGYYTITVKCLTDGEGSGKSTYFYNP